MHAHSAVLLSHVSRHAKLCSLPPLISLLSLQHTRPSCIEFYVSLPNDRKPCAGPRQELTVTRLLSSAIAGRHHSTRQECGRVCAGAASGKLGPLTGDCTLAFPTEKDYVANIRHLGGALSIDLVADYTISSDTKIDLELLRNDFRIAGFQVRCRASAPPLCLCRWAASVRRLGATEMSAQTHSLERSGRLRWPGDAMPDESGVGFRSVADSVAVGWWNPRSIDTACCSSVGVPRSTCGAAACRSESQPENSKSSNVIGHDHPALLSHRCSIAQLKDEA